MPRRDYHFYVYILASRSRTLYIGITSHLAQRTAQHQAGESTFPSLYRIHRLVHIEHFSYVRNAIHREKELKDWPRTRKTALIEATNPTWEDLSITLDLI